MKLASFLTLPLILVTTIAAPSAVIISEAVDATLPGGNPKFVELTNTGPTAFTFTGGGIIVQSNANTDLNIDIDLTGITIAAGESYVIQSTGNNGQSVFESTYGFAADFYTSAFISNGDDRYILATADDGAGVGTTIVDIVGEIDTDGSGSAWEYLDGYIFRNADSITGNGGAFDVSNWTVGGVNSLETGNDVEEAALIVSLTTPGSHIFIPEPSTALLGGLGLLALLRRRRS